MQAQQKEKDLTWLRAAVGDGLMRMYSLRLSGAPAEDMIDVVAEVWLDAVKSLNKDWQEPLDRPRIEQAFTRLIQLCSEWPAPATLIAELPPRKAPKLLPEPPPTKEEAAEILRTLGLTKDFLGRKIAQTKIKEEQERAERNKQLAALIERKKQEFVDAAQRMIGKE